MLVGALTVGVVFRYPVVMGAALIYPLMVLVHKDVEGNNYTYTLAKNTAKKQLPPHHTDILTLPSFKPAIKDWVEQKGIPASSPP